MIINFRYFIANDVSPLLKMSIPLVLTGLIESASPFFGTMFVSELGQAELAAAALVRGLFFTLMVILWGTLTSISVLISQKYGEKDDNAVSQILCDGVLLSIALTPLAFLILWYIAPIFSHFGQNAAVIDLARSYMHGLAWGMLPDFMTVVFLQFLIGLGRTRASMIFMLCWTPFAIFLNYAFIFGRFGMPKLGIGGIGWGLTVSYWVSIGLLIIYLAFSKTYGKYIRIAFAVKPHKYLKQILVIGVPIGAMYCIEVGFFFFLTLAMGLIGEIELAASQITLQYLGVLTSVIFSIAQAVTVRMGHKIGEKNIIEANNVTKAGIFLAVSFMLVVAIFYLFFPRLLMRVDLNLIDPKNFGIIKYSIQFLSLCAFFQLLEATRISLMGSLRALHDTRFTLIASIFGFWLIPLPASYFLYQNGFGGSSLWTGMIIGAFGSTILLYRRYTIKLKHYLGV